MNLLIVALVSGLFGNADSRKFDPTRVHQFVLAPLTLPDRASVQPLPGSPVVRWRVRVAGGILHPPTVAVDGSVLVAHALPNLSQYDARGRREWTVRLGLSPAAASPMVLAEGTRLVISERAEAVYLSNRGTILHRVQIPHGSFESAPTLAAARDGSLLIAEGKRLVHLDGAGRVRYVSFFEQEIRAVLTGAGPVWIVGAAGAVALISGDGRMRPHADFGGRVNAVVRVGETRLLAVRNSKQLVELDLGRRALQVRFADPNLELGSALSTNPSGQTRLLASSDLLLAFSTDGLERFRVELPSSPGTTAERVLGDLTLDPEGHVLVTRPGVDLTRVREDGSVLAVGSTACAQPLRPVALPGRAAVLACRSGVLLRLDEATQGNTGRSPSLQRRGASSARGALTREQ